jgi:hypothetical protein
MQEFFAYETTGFATGHTPKAVGVNMHTDLCGSILLPFGEYQLPDGSRMRFHRIDPETHEPIFLDDNNDVVPFQEILGRFAS